MPSGNVRGVTARTADGHPLVCGGEYTPFSCLEYVPASQSWIDGPALLYDRDNAGGTELPDGTFWFISGNSQTTSELYVNGEFVEGPSLADITTSSYMCATPISDVLTFVGGPSAYIYDWSQGTFENVDDGFEFSAYEAQCGTYIAADGSKQLVVAGGDSQSRSRILDVETRTWREGPRLPNQLSLAPTWQRQDTFVIFGGYSRELSRSVNTILEFDRMEELWITRDETLSENKHFMFLTDVESDIFCI